MTREKITKAQIEAYCKSYISGTPFNIAIMELYRILNCNKEDIEVVIEETIKYLQDWCKRNGVIE